MLSPTLSPSPSPVNTLQCQQASIFSLNTLLSTIMAGREAAAKAMNSQQTKSAAAMSDGAVQKPLRGWRLLGVLSR